MATHRINVFSEGYINLPHKPFVIPLGNIPGCIIPDRGRTLEPHLKFPFEKRLTEQLAARDPPQPFPELPLPDDLPPPARPGYAHAEVQTTGHPDTLERKISPRVQALEAARIAGDRERRFRSLQAAALARRQQVRVARGKAFDPNLIEDRDYELSELVGEKSRFRFRLVSWGGGSPRAVVASDQSVVLVLGGRPQNQDWIPHLLPSANEACAEAVRSIVQLPEEIASASAPTLTGGVGESFNEDTRPRPEHGGIALNTLVFFQLFRSLALKRLVGYGNHLLEVYCPSVLSALQEEKQDFLTHHPTANYPSDSSVFSAATFEFGGPHKRTTCLGQPDRFQAGGWSVLHALGDYVPMRGGHVIFWDLGLVVSFPPGSSILIPTGVIHYSFVKVRAGERRYSLLQWAGAGIPRWFANGRRTDLEFAVQATAAEHAEREAARVRGHSEAIEAFPLERDLPDEWECFYFPFVGSDPRMPVSTGNNAQVEEDEDET
ncbi:hypothetical protein B0H15DRAFT_807675 [Mycena belliarum]|uniref:Uncharacterized protein n=1 Tax=Mycena belliarum TaxID=1033014 RepID=A0AAD6XFM5_9AGAR|nr:hypothetical protein B0H15DRAFT_807675 [Mycena belliae]